MPFHFDAGTPQNQHACVSRREQDWIVYTCPLCPGYERRMHLSTGEIKTRPGADPYILHTGVFVPTGLEHVGSLPN